MGPGPADSGSTARRPLVRGRLAQPRRIPAAGEDTGRSLGGKPPLALGAPGPRLTAYGCQSRTVVNEPMSSKPTLA